MKINYKNNFIDVSEIGKFKINNNEYMVCDYLDNTNSKIVIFQIVSSDNGFCVKDIPKNEMKLVFDTYMMIQDSLLGEE